jgi:hypothetical protein
VERSLVHISLQGSGKGVVVMQIAVPLAKLAIDEVGFDILVHFTELFVILVGSFQMK